MVGLDVGVSVWLVPLSGVLLGGVASVGALLASVVALAGLVGCEEGGGEGEGEEAVELRRTGGGDAAGATEGELKGRGEEYARRSVVSLVVVGAGQT